VHPSGPALRSGRKSCDTPVIRAVPPGGKNGEEGREGGRAENGRFRQLGFYAAYGLPATAHALIASRAGQGKVTTELQFFSRSALDLTVESLVRRYDPFALSP